jgi:hypothetical protein
MKTDVTLEEAISTLASILYQPKLEQVGLLEALHRVLAEDLKSTVDHPSADDSSLDGYAVRLEDTLQASSENPVRLEVIGAVAAGSQPFVGYLEKDQAVKVFTGAPVPDGTTGIVMVENTTLPPTMFASVDKTSRLGKPICKKDKSCVVRRLRWRRQWDTRACLFLPFLELPFSARATRFSSLGSRCRLVGRTTPIVTVWRQCCEKWAQNP